MKEIRLLLVYAFCLSIVLLGTAGTVYSALVEGLRYMPPQSTASIETPAVALASSGTSEAKSGQPVWIVPTQKYSYDTKLIQRRERQASEKPFNAAIQTNRLHGQKIKKSSSPHYSLKDARKAFAYEAQPQRPDFEFYPFVR